MMSTGQGGATLANGNMSWGTGTARWGAGEMQEPSGRDKSFDLQPVRAAGAVLPGQGSLNGSGRIKPADENSFASKNCV